MNIDDYGVYRRKFGVFIGCCGLMETVENGTMERETGIEPATSSLGSWHSAAELLPLRYYYYTRNNLNLCGTFFKNYNPDISRGFCRSVGLRVDHGREDQYLVNVKKENIEKAQKELDFSSPRPRPFIASLSTRIDEYEEGVARFFQWKTGLDYYQTIDRIIDFTISTGRVKIIDLITDTGVFALRIAGRKAFNGRVCSFDSNVTLLERAKQRAAQLNLQKTLDFRLFSKESQLTLPDSFADAAVSIFDLHRHPAHQYLTEIRRVLEPEGVLIIAELTEPKTAVPLRLWRWASLRYIHKNPTEADTVYPDREELIKSLFDAGFRQVIVQEMNSPTTMRPGVFSLIAARK